MSWSLRHKGVFVPVMFILILKNMNKYIVINDCFFLKTKDIANNMAVK